MSHPGCAKECPIRSVHVTDLSPVMTMPSLVRLAVTSLRINYYGVRYGLREEVR